MVLVPMPQGPTVIQAPGRLLFFHFIAQFRKYTVLPLSQFSGINISGNDQDPHSNFNFKFHVFSLFFPANGKCPLCQFQ